MLDIILHNPQIPPNTGNIVRLCANTGSSLHLIRPLGFKIDEKSYRRAGLDYHNDNIMSTYDNFDDCINVIKSRSVYAVTKFGKRSYTDIKFNSGDAILFGSETKGLPVEVTNKFSDEQKIFIPMIRNSRSLNLSNAVSIVVYEAWRQLKFINSETKYD
jgi:tRNA (cytidine/uridine-2'-O-)-methyltransferase